MEPNLQIGEEGPAKNKTNSGRYLLAIAGLALFWGTESFVVQASGFNGAPSTLHPKTYEVIRLGLDAAFAGVLLLLLNRAWLIVTAGASFLLAAVILPYSHYFHHSLSLYAMRSAEEGLAVSDLATKYVPAYIWAALLFALALKILWIIRITPAPTPRKWGIAGCCALACALALLGLQFTSFHLERLRVERADRAVFAYGYLTTWMGEYFLAPNMAEVTQHARELQSISPDRLKFDHVKWPVCGDIVVVQLESVGWEALNCQMNGQEVMPFFSHLAQSSRVFKVRSFHDLGSADMDYAVLADGTPSSTILSYEIPGLSYSNGLPGFLKRYGYHAAAFHGNSGSFFNRRENFDRMAFDEILFKEDFQNVTRPLSRWGVRDADVFDASSQKLRQEAVRQFHFIITVDTHAPFDVLSDDQKEIFPRSSDWRENYFNSLRQLDHDLQKYVESLPEGTLAIFYGDHTPNVAYGRFHSEPQNGAEYVPCVVCLSGHSKSWLPTNISAGLPQDLRILDVENDLRHQIAGDVPAGSADVSAR